VSGQPLCPDHFTAREKAGVGGCVGNGDGLDVLEKKHFYFSSQDLNSRCSRVYPGIFTEFAASY